MPETEAGATEHAAMHDADGVQAAARTLNAESVRRAARVAQDVFSGPLEQTLNEADGRLGDGDTGVTLRRVFARVHAAAQETGGDLGELLGACGRAAAGATGSSLGTLCAVAMLQAGKACAGRTDLPWRDLGGLLQSLVPPLLERGQTQLGDKTVLDMLHAVAQAIANLNEPAAQARAAHAAARQTLDAFRGRPCRIGRARMFGERSVGMDDPGMLALAGLIAALDA